jgi:hypothetical protein
MDAARQVALNWAFLMDVMDMDFDELYPMFKAWCESLPDDKMAEIMATAEALTDEIDDDEDAETLHTEAEIWDGLGDAPGGTWVEDVPTPPRPLGPKGPSVN